MKATDAFGELLRLRRPIITTRETAVRLGVPISRASQLLRSLEKSGLVHRLRRGVWAVHRDVDPFSVPPYLTAPFPAYVSFWSALARHGMIEQVPRQIFVASLDRTKRVATTIGTYSIHHLIPELFSGYDGSEEVGYVATPEKALFDTVYLRAPRGGGILLPELELPIGFQEDRLEEWILGISRPRLRTLVSRGLATVLAGAARSGATPDSAMRLRITITEPYDLVAGAGEVAIVGDELPDESVRERLVVRADEKMRLGRRVIDKVVFQPRHVSNSLDELRQGHPVPVHGTLYPKGGKPLGFIGRAFPLLTRNGSVS